VPARRLAWALIDLLRRLPPKDDRGIKLTLNNLRDELLRWDDASGDLLTLEGLFGHDVERLTVEQYRDAAAIIRRYVRQRTSEDQHLSEAAKQFVLRFCTFHNVVRILTDTDTLHRMARMEPVPKPKGLDSDDPSSDHLVRTGHPAETANVEIPVSANLYGSRLVSYFYIAGDDFPDVADAKGQQHLLEKLVVHDSDEFVYFLGRTRHQSGHGKLPIFMEAKHDPYEHVWKPLEIREKQWFLFDGKAPHYWFAEKDTVAFYVGGSAGGLWRKPIAFGRSHSDSSPGGSYLPFVLDSKREGSRRKKTATIVPSSAPAKPADLPTVEKLTSKTVQNLLGKRLRRRRDAYQISAGRVQELNPDVRGIQANTIGKIENATFETLHMRTIAEFAEALDLTPVELFVRDPPYDWAATFKSNYKLTAEDAPSGFDLPALSSDPDVVPLFDQSRLREPFAIRPYLLRPKKASALTKLQFWHGEADVALLTLEGRVAVYVAPDPLVLALELAFIDKIEMISGASAACFELEWEMVNDLVGKRRLVLLDDVKVGEAFHFNAALPHAVVAADDRETTAVVVTIRNDRRLPEYWVDKRREGR